MKEGKVFFILLIFYLSILFFCKVQELKERRDLSSSTCTATKKKSHGFIPSLFFIARGLALEVDSLKDRINEDISKVNEMYVILTYTVTFFFFVCHHFKLVTVRYSFVGRSSY